MKDEIRRLKGEKGRPTVNPSLPDRPLGDKKPRRTGNWKKGGKTVTVTRTERLPIDPAVLPADARSKGTRRIVIQDLRIEPDNVAFEIERYHWSRERKTYESPLPPAYDGSCFGPRIRHLALALHYQGLQTILTGMGVVISEGGDLAFRAENSTLQLGCDDAGLFKGLTKFLQLCWVHAGRHFMVLDPSTPEFRQILKRFLDALWTFSDRLLEYQRAPRSRDKARLWREFDLVFKPETG